MNPFVFSIPDALAAEANAFLFQNHLEQAVFFFASVSRLSDATVLEVQSLYKVPAEGWRHQAEIYLEMKDEERGRIMKLARDQGAALIDSHSHPRSAGRVGFSPSDIRGITEFAAYSKWKLPGRPYGAAVWGEKSVDAVVWDGDFDSALGVSEVKAGAVTLIPRGTWFEKERFGDESF
jgi:hypothetical protein